MEAEADWDHLRTPETYLGAWRSERFASPEQLGSNHWGLSGEWTIGRENVVLDQAGGSIAFRFHARDAHLVLAPGGRSRSPSACSSTARLPAPHTAWMWTRRETACFGRAGSTSSCGEHGAIRERTLEITFLEAGAEAYAFTFG